MANKLREIVDGGTEQFRREYRRIVREAIENKSCAACSYFCAGANVGALREPDKCGHPAFISKDLTDGNRDCVYWELSESWSRMEITK